MSKNEKFKLYLYVFLTPVIIITMIIIAITTREKPLLARDYNETHSQRELLDVINHNHTF